ncbi:MAG: DUF2279 domain-containing protein [Bacteroidetes bacterium]|nr:DUF2279 domain-containing protein [Bacteroidota bacterium]
MHTRLSVVFFFCWSASLSQPNSYSDTTQSDRPDSTKKISYNSRRIWAGAGQTLGYGTALVLLNQTWYSQYPRSSWKVFNDWSEWKQMDKFGHVYGTYVQGRASMEIWRWAGVPRKTRIWVGGLTGTAFQTLVEYMDGRSAAWGWSWGDIGANLLGSTALIAQELAWDEQRIQLKLSFHPTRYSDPQLQQRSIELFGENWASRIMKDYNAQTYWASVRIKSFLKKAKVPEWLCVSFGTGASGLWGGARNIKKDAAGNVLFDRSDIPRRRQWYLSPDIDHTKIHTRKKWVRFALLALSAFKVPLPTLEMEAGKWRLRPLYF